MVAHSCFPLGEKTAKSTLQHETFEDVNNNISHSSLARASDSQFRELGCESYDTVSNTVPSTLLQFIQLHEYQAIDNGGYLCMKRLCPLCVAECFREKIKLCSHGKALKGYRGNCKGFETSQGHYNRTMLLHSIACNLYNLTCDYVSY